MIQLGTFNRKINADALRKKLAIILGKEVEIFVEDELYKVRIIGFKTRDEVETYLPVLHKNGVSEMKILTLKGKQNYRTAISKLDTISGETDNVGIKDTSYLINKETFEDLKKSPPDSSTIIKKAIAPVKKKEELTPSIISRFDSL